MDIEMKNFAPSHSSTKRKSMDTKATDDKDGIIIPYISEEDDSLIGDQDNSMMDSKLSRNELIQVRRR